MVDAIIMKALADLGVHVSRRLFDRWLESQNRADGKQILQAFMLGCAATATEVLKQEGRLKAASQDDFAAIWGVIGGGMTVAVKIVLGVELPHHDILSGQEWDRIESIALELFEETKRSA
jgi:hypothetical protein